MAFSRQRNDYLSDRKARHRSQTSQRPEKAPLILRHRRQWLIHCNLSDRLTLCWTSLDANQNFLSEVSAVCYVRAASPATTSSHSSLAARVAQPMAL